MIALGYSNLRGVATRAALDGVEPYDTLAACCPSPAVARLTTVYEAGRTRLAVVPTATEERVLEGCRRVYPYAVFADLRLATERGCADVGVMVKSARLQPFITVGDG